MIDQKIDTQGAFGRFSWDGELAGHKADMFFGAYYRQGGNKQGLFVNMGGVNGFQFGMSGVIGTSAAAGLLNVIDTAGGGRLTLSGFNIYAGGTSMTNVTVSIGVATLVPQPDQLATALVSAADTALYAAKHSGRDRVMSSASATASETTEA